MRNGPRSWFCKKDTAINLTFYFLNVYDIPDIFIGEYRFGMC